jgi:uncharacterized Zn finger protein (UPF0148 family)
MSYLHCPVCGLNVPRTRETKTGTEDCPRCLARSSGTTSVKLASGRARKSTPSRRRVTKLLRELRPGR